MSDLQLIPVGAAYKYTIDFTADIPATVTVTAVTFSAPGLTLGTQQDELGSYRSTILVSGAEHGRSYILAAYATLSNGETLEQSVTLKGWNG
jgi:hypothetical protein